VAYVETELSKEQNELPKLLLLQQGDQMEQIFASWAIVYFWPVFGKLQKIAKFWATFSLLEVVH
jgi:hypothetical protein